MTGALLPQNILLKFYPKLMISDPALAFVVVSNS